MASPSMSSHFTSVRENVPLFKQYSNDAPMIQSVNVCLQFNFKAFKFSLFIQRSVEHLKYQNSGKRTS